MSRQRLRDLVGVHGDPGLATEAFFAECRNRAAVEEATRDIIEWVAKCEMRTAARHAEDKAFPFDVDATDEVRSLARKRLLTESFPLGDGTFVSWAAATAADHLARVEYLNKLKGGIETTIGRHLEAVALIEAAGVSCLGELEAAA